MAAVKTAISIDERLFKQANAMARRMKVSRSKLFAIAVENMVRQDENRRLLERVNAAYADPPDETERDMLRAMRVLHARAMEGQW